MDNNLCQLQYELDLIKKILKKVEKREIWWLDYKEDVAELQKRKNLLEILLENAWQIKNNML